jgi:hypothetical protein
VRAKARCNESRFIRIKSARLSTPGFLLRSRAKSAEGKVRPRSSKGYERTSDRQVACYRGCSHSSIRGAVGFRGTLHGYGYG